MKLIKLTCKDTILKLIFFLYLFSSILEKIKWNVLGWSYDVFTLFSIILFCFLVLYFFITSHKIRINCYEKKIFIYYILYFLYLFIQFFILQNSNDIRLQFFKGVISLFLQLLSYINIVMILQINKNIFNSRLIMRFLMYITIINVFYCLVQNFNPNIDESLVLFFKSTVSRYGVDPYGELGRVTGLLLESNFNGPFLVIGFVNMVYYFNSYKMSSFKKKVLFIMLSLTFIEIILSFSRTAYLGIAVFLVLYFFKINRIGKFKSLLILLCAIAIFLTVYYRNEYFKIIIDTRFNFLGNGKLSDDSHFLILLQSLAIYSSSLSSVFFGVGLNCLNIYFQNVFQYAMMKAHNFFLQTLCEVGVFGLGLTIYYYSLLFKESLYAGRNGAFLKMILIVSFSMNFTYDPLSRNFNIFLLAFSLTLHNERILKERKNSNECYICHTP